MAPATSSELYASAAIMAKNCNASNKAYLLCKTASPNPGSCLEEGSAVTACGDGLIAKLKSSAKIIMLGASLKKGRLMRSSQAK